MNEKIELSDTSEIEESEPPVSPKPQSVLQGLTKEDDTIIEFIENNYPNTTITQWNDWTWQIKNSITKSEDLIQILGKKKENIILNIPTNHLPFRITPYFASLLDRLETNHPLYKTIIPTVNELNSCSGEKSDPLNEEGDSPVKNIVHRYPDRALFLVTGFCSTYCRYCTRSHMVSKRTDIHVSKSEWDEAFQYLEKHTEIRDVIVSGGDPLTLSNDNIEYILSRLRRIEHIEIIRIGTKVPVVLPQRITQELVDMLKKYHPLFLSVHFTHPDELSKETKRACNLLIDNGIILRSQTVLLKGINDSVETMKSLMHKLLMVRVVPYYIYQMDKIPGGEHFETTISKGIEIIHGLRGYTSGYAIPQYIVDSSIGKMAVNPNYIKEITDDGRIVFENYMGNTISQYRKYD
jgi:lysine 2,3-aminomutase